MEINYLATTLFEVLYTLYNRSEMDEQSSKRDIKIISQQWKHTS
jgi:hypothetical protein